MAELSYAKKSKHNAIVKITHLTFCLVNGYLTWCGRAMLLQLSAEEQ